MNIVFPYIAQLHQVPHSLPIAIELARRHPEVRVHVACVSKVQLSFVQRMLQTHAPDVPLQVDRLRLDPLSTWRAFRGQAPFKQMVLLRNRDYFRRFDAIVTPERTSLFLRRIGVERPRLIWTRHGAGDREIGFAADVHQFDFVLMAGQRIAQRLLELGQIRPDDHAVGVYAKFDWLRPALRPTAPLFDNERPTVLYNPHFRGALSSWPRFGWRVLEQFAASERYNLVFAPHVRLFEGARRPRAFAAFENLPHLRIDLGSERSIDMSYTRAADLYLGDVSSQVCEFLYASRPCLFLNAHGVSWQDNPNYAFWQLGPVSAAIEDLHSQVDAAFATHEHFRERQRRYFEQTFELPAGSVSAARGADAIVAYLRRAGPRPAATLPGVGRA